MEQFESGKYVSQGSYKSFQPSLINRQWSNTDMKVQELLGKADRELGRLDMYSEHIPNISLYISMHVLKEATQSSRIEGTQTNMKEALLEQDEVPVEKRDDWEEVQNYIKAMNVAIESLENIPFSSRLIKETHKTLLQGVRGEHKLPGAFRKSQNWIGGSKINNAKFIPPVHHTIGDYMSDLEKFAHNEDIYVPMLLRIALIHYQFETIHPFLDGNGRVGRLMITLYLVEKNILQEPILYLSDYLERHRQDYYENLTKVREENDITQWFIFFLTGIIETAQDSILTFKNILQLQKDVNEEIQKLGARTVHAQKVLEHLYQKPLVTADEIQKLTAISMPTVYNLIKELEELDILNEITGAKRGRKYLFSKYLSLFEPR
jgi:Fic family protein